jgi:BlaI family penicillinase repressor
MKKKPTAPKISDAEWLVMDVLWSRDSATAGEVVEALAPRAAWNDRTIKTMLNRLIKKGAVSYEPDGKRYIYRPAVTREAAIRIESRSFLKRVFGGEVGPMLAHFVEDAKLSPKQVQELKKLLDRKDA